MKKISILTSLLFSCFSIFAHALWIETKASGKKGQAHQVNIFYGEYSEGKPEKIADWYSDVRAFKLWLVSPTQQKTLLTADSTEDHFVSSFTPQEDGVYYLQISHDAKDLGRTTLYQFNTSATVKVGSTGAEDLGRNINPLKFTVGRTKIDQPVDLKAFYDNTPCDSFKATIFSPQGWVKEVEGVSGVTSFLPEWKGKYMIEVTRTDKNKGEHHGKAYESVWRCATMLVNVD